MFMLEDIYSETLLTSVKYQNKNLVQADMQVNAYGKSTRIKKLFNYSDWEQIKRQGYFTI